MGHLLVNGSDHDHHCGDKTNTIDATKQRIGKIANQLSSNRQYFNNERCKWLLKLPKDSRLIFKFIRIDVEINLNLDNCTYDWVDVYEGNNVNNQNKLIERFCRPEVSLKRRIITNVTDEIIVMFHSDDTGQRRGFEMWWMVIGENDDPDQPFNFTVALPTPEPLVSTTAKSTSKPTFTCTWFNSCYLLIFATVCLILSMFLAGFVCFIVKHRK